MFSFHSEPASVVTAGKQRTGSSVTRARFACLPTLAAAFLIAADVLAVAIAAPAVAAAQPTSNASQAGRLLADSAIQLHKALTQGRQRRGSAGVLIADGDSWFDYPGTDLLRELDVHFGYAVESISHYGKTIEGIALSEAELADLLEKMERVKDQGGTPTAILLSAGGNDIAGSVLGVVLNNRVTAPPRIDPVLMRELIDIRIRNIMLRWMYAVTRLSHSVFGGTPVPILIQGYDYAVPDGRGFSKFWFTWAGPWLKPAFDARGYAETDGNTAQMRILIDDFNAMLASIPNEPGLSHVRYVKLLGTLSSDPSNYQMDWDNELHPTPRGFRSLAGKLDAAIKSLPRRTGTSPRN